MALGGEIADQSLRRNVYCTKEIAYFPNSVTFTADGNDLDVKILIQHWVKSMLEKNRATILEPISKIRLGFNKSKLSFAKSRESGARNGEKAESRPLAG
jgi:hypothetical protein